MEQRLYEALQSNPIIAAVRDDEGLEACLQADVQTVFVLYGDIFGIAGIVRRIKDAGKIAIVHADLITGLAAKEISVDFLHSTTLADGIISTRTRHAGRRDVPARAGYALLRRVLHTRQSRRQPDAAQRRDVRAEHARAVRDDAAGVMNFTEALLFSGFAHTMLCAYPL